MNLDPVRVSVSQVRQSIFAAAGRPAQGVGSAAGQLFHRTAECALGDGQPAGWRQALTSTLNEGEWLDTLYKHFLGPELNRLQPLLAGEEVLRVWLATQQLLHWFCGLLREAIAAGSICYDERLEKWTGAESLFQSECEVEKIFFEQDWSRAVVVSGRLDQCVRTGPDRWCVVEFKLGDGHAEADAAQVCLYHELLGGVGSAAILHFGDGLEAGELLLSPAAMQQARATLIALVGTLAGVTKPRQTTAETAPGDHSWPRKPGQDEIETGTMLVRTLREYGAEAQLSGDPLVGPAFVRYLLEPLRGVTVASIEKRGAELQVRLQLDCEPVIHRVEGRIAVDVQRRHREYVSFASLRPALDTNLVRRKLASVLAGVDLRGKVHFVDLDGECPHLLVGGQSGSGKTEWLRAAVASLAVTNTPESLRLAVVDPKKNAFPELAGSPLLLRPDALIDSPDGLVLDLLHDLLQEIYRRQALFRNVAANDLTQYRQKTRATLPRIVCIVDEFAELLLAGGRKQRDDFEAGFIRIAAVGRSAGVHLILATQRPDRRAVSGNLKANLPGKIAMRVSTRTDSGVLIDQSGAQLLLGKGDLLLAGLASEPVRLQSAWISEEERRALYGDGLRFTSVVSSAAV